MRQELTFTLSPEACSNFVVQALQWAMQEDSRHLAYYTSCQIPYPQGAFPHLLAIGAHALHELGDAPFDQLQKLHDQQPDWYFGYFTYDLKNRVHGLKSRGPQKIAFPPCRFFQPKHLIFFEQDQVRIASLGDPRDVFEAISAQQSAPLRTCANTLPKAQMGKKEYLRKVHRIKEHIREGDCYELNLCFEFSADSYAEDPLMLFRQLMATSPAPFACFQRHEDQYLISASPERFLKKEGQQLVSQPIKGTIRRGSTAAEDQQLKSQLRMSEKDRAENMMIVDLVRNDLARSCSWGSVSVPELFGIYSFRQVHQMISTISGSLRPGIAFTEAIRAAFPMGSMTGAPKKIVMELIDQYENSQRGLYSGAAGFITPAGNFDFNVVIRSMLYDAHRQRLSFSVGGAITWDSEPEQEWEECLLKARAILQLLGHSPAHFTDAAQE